MKRSFISLLAGRSLLGSPLISAAPYDARIREKEILTPAPARAPRISGPSTGSHGHRHCHRQRRVKFLGDDQLPATLGMRAIFWQSKGQDCASGGSGE